MHTQMANEPTFVNADERPAKTGIYYHYGLDFGGPRGSWPCAPEAAVGGPIALVADGDEISFDLLAGEVTLRISDEELGRRRQQWRPVARKSRRGYLLDFAATVSQANYGCVSRPLYPDCL
jgi:hypothetical protein